MSALNLGSEIATNVNDKSNYFDRLDKVVFSDERVRPKSDLGLPPWLFFRNSYSVAAHQFEQPALHLFCSSTGTPIDVRSMAGLEVEPRREVIEATMDRTRFLIACELMNVRPNEKDPNRLARVEKIAKRLLIDETGTHPPARIRAANPRTGAALLMQEMGSGTRKAVESGLIPDSSSYHQQTIIAGIKPLPEEAVKEIPFRDKRGNLLTDEQIVGLLRANYADIRDQEVMAQFPFPPKTGKISEGMFRFIRQLVSDGKTSVGLDWAQFRLNIDTFGAMYSEAINWLYEGKIDLILSLSKKKGFPPFIGAWVMSKQSQKNMTDFGIAKKMQEQGTLKLGYLNRQMANEMGIETDELEPDLAMHRRLMAGLPLYEQYLSMDIAERLKQEEALGKISQSSFFDVFGNAVGRKGILFDTANLDHTGILAIQVSGVSDPRQKADLIVEKMMVAEKEKDSFVLAKPVVFQEKGAETGNLIIRLPLGILQTVATQRPGFLKDFQISVENCMRKLKTVLNEDVIGTGR